SLTALALVATAANYLLCRLLLGEARIDAASHTSRRLLASAGRTASSKPRSSLSPTASAAAMLR
ncbi:MAG: EamA family transporter, partial [Pseudomonadota bacterium]